VSNLKRPSLNKPNVRTPSLNTSHQQLPAKTPNTVFEQLPPKAKHLFLYLSSLLENLQSVEQSPTYHPEGNALYHSLQVFECALADSNNPILWTAALFHDVGKAMDYPNHAQDGADALEGLLDPHTCWLIRHHLDLLIHPKKTRKRLKGSTELYHLEKLRKWDLQGRNPNIEVMDIPQALELLLPHFLTISV